MTSPLLEAALGYVARGCGVIPLVPRSKEPLVPWKVWQTRWATWRQVEAWWRTWPSANVGLVTGTVSSVAALDLDPRNDPSGETSRWLTTLMPPPTVISGSGGWHWWGVHEGLPTIHGLRPGLDIIGEGGFVVAPPSTHPNGRPYERVADAVRPVPAEILELVRRHAAQVAAEKVAAKNQHNGASQNQAPDDRLTLAEVLGLLEHVRRVRGGWKARCPVHGTEQSSTSLSVTRGADGRLLLRCWAGCRFQDVLRALRAAQVAGGGGF